MNHVATEGRNRVVIPDPAPALPPPPGWTRRDLTGTALGTQWVLGAYAPPGITEADLRQVVEVALAEVCALFSTWDEESEISTVNRAGNGPLAISPRFAEVLARALSMARQTGGAVDPTLGRLTELWGFGPAGPPAAPPTPEEIAAARAACGWARVSLGPAGLSRPVGMRLDLGGIAKGWAVDLVSDRLAAAGLTSHLIEIGGELRGHGLKPDGLPWWARIEGPPGHHVRPILVALAGAALATSGNWRRGVRYGGRHYGHTIDPATGWPADNGVASVSVIAAEAMQADMLATALWVMGADAGMDFAARHGIAALMVLRGPDGFTEHASPAFTAMGDAWD